MVCEGRQVRLGDLRSIKEQLHIVVFAPLRRIARNLLLRNAGSPLLTLRALLAIILICQLIEHPRHALTATRERITHRTIVSGQSNRVKSAESRFAEDSRWSSACVEAGGLETTVEESIWCEGRRGAGLRTHAEMGVLDAGEGPEVWGVRVVVTGWEAG